MAKTCLLLLSLWLCSNTAEGLAMNASGLTVNSSKIIEKLPHSEKSNIAKLISKTVASQGGDQSAASDMKTKINDVVAKVITAGTKDISHDDPDASETTLSSELKDRLRSLLKNGINEVISEAVQPSKSSKSAMTTTSRPSESDSDGLTMKSSMPTGLRNAIARVIADNMEQKPSAIAGKLMDAIASALSHQDSIEAVAKQLAGKDAMADIAQQATTYLLEGDSSLEDTKWLKQSVAAMTVQCGDILSKALGHDGKAQDYLAKHIKEHSSQSDEQKHSSQSKEQKHSSQSKEQKHSTERTSFPTQLVNAIAHVIADNFDKGRSSVMSELPGALASALSDMGATGSHVEVIGKQLARNDVMADIARQVSSYYLSGRSSIANTADHKKQIAQMTIASVSSLSKGMLEDDELKEFLAKQIRALSEAKHTTTTSRGGFLKRLFGKKKSTTTSPMSTTTPPMSMTTSPMSTTTLPTTTLRTTTLPTTTLLPEQQRIVAEIAAAHDILSALKSEHEKTKATSFLVSKNWRLMVAVHLISSHLEKPTKIVFQLYFDVILPLTGISAMKVHSTLPSLREDLVQMVVEARAQEVLYQTALREFTQTRELRYFMAVIDQFKKKSKALSELEAARYELQHQTAHSADAAKQFQGMLDSLRILRVLSWTPSTVADMTALAIEDAKVIDENLRTLKDMELEKIMSTQENIEILQADFENYEKQRLAQKSDESHESHDCWLTNLLRGVLKKGH